MDSTTLIVGQNYSAPSFLSIPLNGFTVGLDEKAGAPELCSFNSIEWIHHHSGWYHRFPRLRSFNSIEWIPARRATPRRLGSRSSFNSIEWIHGFRRGYRRIQLGSSAFQFHWMDSYTDYSFPNHFMAIVAFQFHWMDSSTRLPSKSTNSIPFNSIEWIHSDLE